MEDQQFDELTKKLAGPVSRRTAVKAAIATAVGGVFALGKVAGAGAAFSQTCKCNGQPCFLDSQCCSGSCSGKLNGVKVCECPAGTTACQGTGAFTTCVPNCTGGQVINAGTCTCVTVNTGACTNVPAANNVCAGQAACTPALAAGCLCSRTTEGTGQCTCPWDCSAPVCASSADCPAGQSCMLSCCGTPQCRPPCTATVCTAATTTAAVSGQWSHPR